MGESRKPPSRRRPELVNLRVTPEEKRRWREAVPRLGYPSLGALVRDAVEKLLELRGVEQEQRARRDLTAATLAGEGSRSLADFRPLGE